MHRSNTFRNVELQNTIELSKLFVGYTAYKKNESCCHLLQGSKIFKIWLLTANDKRIKELLQKF